MEIDEYIKTEDAVFHYTKKAIAIEDILFSKKLKLSCLKDTNDPREYKFHLLNMMGWSLPDDITNLIKDAHPVIDNILKNECRSLFFCSNKKPTVILENKTQIEDDNSYSKGWCKSRMWSQYGESHFGICLVFSKEKIEEALESEESKIHKYQADYVKYLQKERIAPKAVTLDGNRLAKEGVQKYSKAFVLENMDELFFRKHADYRDESEYRVVVFDPDKKMEYIDIGPLIKGVIVGDRTPKVYFSLINKLCEALQVESRRLHWDRGKPHLIYCKDEKESSMELLKKLKIENEEILLIFLVLYSRIEYSLKRSGFYNTGKNAAEPNWGKYISSIKDNFNPIKNSNLKSATEFLLKFPAKVQIIDNNELDFEEHSTTKEGPDIFRIYHCIRITRNNLFHGGKFPKKPEIDISRNKELIKNCITVLEEFVELDKTVQSWFWEIA